MPNKVIKGDKGTVILLDAGTSLTTQSKLEIHYKKPSGVTGEWAATVYASDFAKFTTASDSLDEAGVWTLYIYTELAGGWEGRGEAVGMKVYDEWES